MASAGRHYRRKAGARKSFLAYCRTMGNKAPTSQALLAAKHMDGPGPMRLMVTQHRRWLLRVRTAQALRGVPRVRLARIRRGIRNIDYREVARHYVPPDAPTTDWVALFKKTDQPG